MVTSQMKTEETPQIILLRCAEDALAIAKTALKNKKSLSGGGFYAGKLSVVKAEATNALRYFSNGSEENVNKLRSVVEKLCSGDKLKPAERSKAAYDLQFILSTDWSSDPVTVLAQGGVLPFQILEETKRGYLIKIGKEINGCYQSGFYNGCAVMMRRLLEVSIIEAFEARQCGDKIKNKDGHYYLLDGLISKVTAGTLGVPLSRTAKNNLSSLQDLGNFSAHGKNFFANIEDINGHQMNYRVIIEEFLRIARLIQ